MVGKSFKTIVITPTINQKSDFSPMSQVVGFAHIEPKKIVFSPRNYSPASASKSPSNCYSVSPSIMGDRSSPKTPMGTPPSNYFMGDQHYAGAKFSDPPNPTKLPKPPSSWMGSEEMKKFTQAKKNPKPRSVYPELFSLANIKVAQNHMKNYPFTGSEGPVIVPEKNCKAMTNHLKLLLKVQA